jgi:hypothetical protein
MDNDDDEGFAFLLTLLQVLPVLLLAYAVEFGAVSRFAQQTADFIGRQRWLRPTFVVGVSLAAETAGIGVAAFDSLVRLNANWVALFVAGACVYVLSVLWWEVNDLVRRQPQSGPTATPPGTPSDTT